MPNANEETDADKVGKKAILLLKRQSAELASLRTEILKLSENKIEAVNDPPRSEYWKKRAQLLAEEVDKFDNTVSGLNRNASQLIHHGMKMQPHIDFELRALLEEVEARRSAVLDYVRRL